MLLQLGTKEGYLVKQGAIVKVRVLNTSKGSEGGCGE